MRLIDADVLRLKDMVDGMLDVFDVLEAPTVEAIPVEWLKKKSEEFAERYWNKQDDHKKLILPMKDCPVVIAQMIKEWEMERKNERSNHYF